MKECTKKECNAAGIGDTDNFCYRCGSVLRERTFCNCGYQYSKADSFCPKCGIKKGINLQQVNDFEKQKAEEERDREKEKV